MKLHVLFYLLISPFFALAKGNENNGFGNIKGIITTKDGKPAAWVNVLIKNTQRAVQADNNGNFEISKLKPDTYILIVSLLDHIENEIAVVVKESETVFVNIQLQQTETELKEVIVKTFPLAGYVETNTSASLPLHLPLTEVPQNITVVSNQLITDQGLLSTTEAIRSVSGVEKTYGGLNEYTLIMRGTEISSWSLYRNGIGGYWWNQQEDADMLEKIEFIKGPAGFMANASDAGGVLNSITKQPVKESLAHINACFGSFNLMRLAVDLGGAFTKNKRFSYRFNAGIHNQDRDFRYGKALRYFICPVIKYEFNKKTSLTAEYNFMWARTLGNNDGLPSVNGKLFSLPRNFAVADDKTSRLIASDNYYRIHLKHDFNTSWHANLQLAYIYGKWGGYQISTSDLPVVNDTLYRYVYFDHFRNSSKVAMGFIDGRFYTGKKVEHKLLFGPEFDRWNITDPSGNTSEKQGYGVYTTHPDYYIDPDSLRNFTIDDTLKWTVNSLAFYIQDNIKISGKLIITMAGHFTGISINVSGADVPDYQKKINRKVFTPRAGLIWLFTNDISLYALYDKCFLAQTAPNVEHKQFDPLNGYNLEAGMKMLFRKKLGLNFSVFHIVKNNVISPDPLHSGYFIQTGEVISKGVDVDMAGNITAALNINVNYEYVDAKITRNSDENLIGLRNFGTPDHSGNCWIKYMWQHHMLKGFSFALGYHYTGKRSGASVENPDKNKFLSSYSLLDASVGFRNRQFNITLNVNNIMNSNYASIGLFSTNTNEWRYTPGEQANFRLSAGLNLAYHKERK